MSISAVPTVWKTQQNFNLVPVNRCSQALISDGIVSKLQFNLPLLVDDKETHGAFSNLTDGL